MVYDLFSKQARLQRGEVPEVYVYDQLPRTLRVQITYLFDQAFSIVGNQKEPIYKLMSEVLREERGVYELADGVIGDHYGARWHEEKEIKNYFLTETNTEFALDVVDLFFRIIRNTVYGQGSNKNRQDQYETLIDRLNTRFKEHGVGYVYEAGSLIRIDSEVIHQTVIRPTLKLLHSKEYANAESEYLSAHEHYRNGKYSECLVDCLKAVESTIKIIGHKRGWKIAKGDTASKLIAHVMDNKLIPDYLQTHFNALRACLESGVPTVRNKSGGHGKGTDTETVPAYMAEYLLGQAATVIRLVVAADKEKK